MGVVTFSIASTNVLPYLQVKSVLCDNYINQRPVMRFKLRVKDGDSYRPSVRDQVEFTDDSEIIFGGVVFNVTETDVINYKHRDLSVDAVGYEVFADNVLFNGVVSAGDLKDQLAEVVANLAPHGITIDSFMASGPAMDALPLPFTTIRGALDQLTTVSGWNWKFDTSQHVIMEDPGTVGAPFALDDTNSTLLSLEHKTSLANYANEVWVRFGGSGTSDVTDGFIGDGVEDTFILHYPVSVVPGTVIENGVTYPLGGVGGWTYSPTPTPRVIKSSPPTNGHVITVTFNAEFPGYVFVRNDVEYAAKGPWTVIVDYPDIKEHSQAENAAAGELARRQGVVRRLTARTLEPGLEPGMTVNVTATKRDLSSVNFLIDHVNIQHETRLPNGEHLFSFTVDALEGNQSQRNWQDYFRRMNNATGGGSGVAGGVSSGGGSTATTVRGAFWGGSRQFGDDSGNWVDAVNWLPISIDGTAGVPTTVRVEQRTDSAGTSVTVRIVKVVGGTVMATGAASTSTSWDEELLTFTPSTGANDYKLQFKGANTSAQVYAIGQSL